MGHLEHTHTHKPNEMSIPLNIHFILRNIVEA